MAPIDNVLTNRCAYSPSARTQSIAVFPDDEKAPENVFSCDFYDIAATMAGYILLAPLSILTVSGCSSELVPLYPDTCGDQVPVQVGFDDGIDQERRELFSNWLAATLPLLDNSCFYRGATVILKENIPSSQKILELGGHTRGEYRGQGKVWINNRYFEAEVCEASGSESNLVHELGHKVYYENLFDPVIRKYIAIGWEEKPAINRKGSFDHDIRIGGGGLVQDLDFIYPKSDEKEDFYCQKDEPFPCYAMWNPWEDFAQTFAAYLMDAYRFRQQAGQSDMVRARYDLLKEYVFNGREYSFWWDEMAQGSDDSVKGNFIKAVEHYLLALQSSGACDNQIKDKFRQDFTFVDETDQQAAIDNLLAILDEYQDNAVFNPLAPFILENLSVAYKNINDTGNYIKYTQELFDNYRVYMADPFYNKVFTDDLYTYIFYCTSNRQYAEQIEYGELFLQYYKELEPAKSAYVMNSVASAYFMLEEYNEGIALYQQLLVDYPDSEYCDNALYQMGFYYQSIGEYASAIAEFEALVAGYCPESDFCETVQWNIGQCYQAMGDYPAAITAYETFLEAYPSDLSCDYVQFTIADCYAQMGDYSAAAAAYETLEKNYPNSSLCAKAIFNAGVYRQKAEEYLKAIDDYDKYISEYAENCGWAPSYCQSAYIGIAQCWSQLGRVNLACEAYRAYLAVYPNGEFVTGVQQEMLSLDCAP